MLRASDRDAAIWLPYKLFKRKKIMTKYILLIVFLISCYATKAQSPWVDNKGSLYVQGSFNTITYSSIFNSDGGSSQIGFETTDRTYSIYGSYSITDRTGILFNLPYKSVTANDASLSAFGDISLKVKHELLGNSRLTAYAGYTAPTATREGNLRTGYDQHSIDVGLSTGFSSGKTYGYFGSGYRYRENIPSQFIIDAEIGTSSVIGGRTLSLIFHIDGALNFSTVEDLEGDETVLYHNNGQFLSPGIKVSFNAYKNWWINLGGFGAITARNQGAGGSISIGIAYSLKR